MNNPLNQNHSSKLKRVFIELYNYSFSHGSPELGDSDERFIGRERLLEKFKSVLTNTIRKSGIYLVTGYRGMGKTSFVNKALADIYSPSRKIKSIYNFGVYLMISFLLAILLMLILKQINPFHIIGNQIFNHKITSIDLVMSFYALSLGILLLIDLIPSRNLKTIWLQVTNQSSEQIDLRHKQYIEKLILIVLFSLIAILLYFCIILILIREKVDLSNIHKLILSSPYILLGFVGSYLLYIGTNIVGWQKNLKNNKRNKTQMESSENPSKKSDRKRLIEPFRRFINYSSTIHINLNLGYSNLKEINVLKLIARNLKSSFEQHQQTFSINKLIRILIFILIFCFAWLIYSIEPVNRFNKLLKTSIGLNVMFPSQYNYFLNDDSLKLKRVVDVMHDNNKLTAENYFIYIQSITSDYGDTKNLDTVLRYLNYFDKSLIDYLNIDSMESMSYDSFISEFKRKEKNFFKILNNYKFICNDQIDDIVKFVNIDSTKSKEISDLIIYNEENSNVKITREEISLVFLYRLKKLTELYKNYNDLNTFHKKIIACTNYADYFIYQGYYYTRKFLPAHNNNSKKKIAPLIPIQIDYLYILYIIFFFYFFKLIQRLINYNRPTLRSVTKKLNFINELIDSNLTLEKSSELKVPRSTLSFIRRKNQVFPQADEREIEKYIIEIINDISRLPINSYRSEFIIVFDELDKIEPNIDKNDTPSSTTLYSPESIRIRLQTVMVLLSNLKYFLSTAKAKFIFIAGREMYDASLADVSDRNFRIGSIFHDIFYINSFYSDITEYDIEDITSRTEQYVCQFLMPDLKKCTSLKDFNKHLKETPEFNEDSKDDSRVCDKIIAKQKREKIIYLLQHFIVYLNHQSAGAPSKITSYFENYVVSKDMFKSNWTDYCIFVGKKNSNNLFLFFDYFDQYELGLVNYMITPFNYSINKSIRNYGDKLIVSASFLHNHLFKFHRNAFSWRDLEATPEMVDINKNPELRDFLTRLMDFMLKTHIQEVIYGIYDFKFPKKITQELIFLSHISEEASASFNFTLDESLVVKQHYREQLLKLKESASLSDIEKNIYVYSVSSINLTIADLCFYDGDYGDAILYYLEAIQQIRNKPVEELTITQLALLTRNMLKLGYSLEKRKTYDSAHLTYSEITDKIINRITHAFKAEENINFLRSVLNNLNYFYQPLLAKLYLIEKTSSDGLNASDLKQIYKEFEILQSVFKVEDKYDDKLEVMIAEKKGITNEDKTLIKAEFWIKIGNLLYYKNCIIGEEPNCPYPNSPNVVECPFRCCSACKKYIDSLNIILLKQEIHIYVEYIENEKTIHVFDLDNFINEIKRSISIHNNNNNRNIEYRLMAMLFSNIGDIFLTCAKDEKIKIEFLNEVFSYINNDDNKKLDNLQFDYKNKLEAMLFMYLCSSYYYRVSNDHKNASVQLTNILCFLNEYTTLHEIERLPDDEAALLNEPKESVEEIISKLVDKIANRAIKDMYCSYDFIHNYEINRFKRILDNNQNIYLEDLVLKRGSINSDLDEINIPAENVKLNFNTPISLNVKKTIDLYNLISPYCINTNMYNRILKLKFREKINTIIFNRNLEIHEIKNCESLEYYDILKSISKNIDAQIAFLGLDILKIEIVEFLISDSIFCCFEIIKLCSTFDKSFSLNYSLLAETHKQLWIWSEYLNIYLLIQGVIKMLKENKYLKKNQDYILKNIDDPKVINNIIVNKSLEEILYYIKKTVMNTIKEISDISIIEQVLLVWKSQYQKNLGSNIIENIARLIEPDNVQFISPIYQCEKAISAYFSMQYTHQQGQAYKSLIDNMYYLNDDFNDDSYHFSVAIERYKINNGVVKTNIDNLRKRTARSDLYKHDNYINESI